MMKTTIRLVRKFQADFEELGTFAFETRKSGGLPTEFAILNEDQANYLWVEEGRTVSKKAWDMLIPSSEA
jgi:hypothetical protein